MTVVVVRHSQGSYPVYIEPGVLGRLGELVSEHLPGRRVAMIADATVEGSTAAAVWARPRGTGRRSPSPRASGRRPGRPGAASPTSCFAGATVATAASWRSAAASRAISAGFVAATYLRGVPYLQAPTSLLAMLDASVGGKTGVDTAEGKNLIGAFHPPVAVLADPRALATLPDRDYRAGLAEAVKHGLIADREYFEWMEREVGRLLARDAAALQQLVRRSVEIKAAVVGEDEREAGRRAILNAGHTVAHALERETGYRLAHGEAVGLGLVAEAALAAGLGLATPEAGARVAALLGRLGLPTRLPEPVAPDRLIAAMSHDKKNRARGIRFALPRGVGAMGPGPDWTTEAGEPAIRAALAAIS